MTWLSFRVSARARQALIGATALTLILSVIVAGVEETNGAWTAAHQYQVKALFTAAGQGLLPRSDVKMHGVDIGQVRGVKLEGGRALVTMGIDKSHPIPVDANATIRPKTLFGEKFVDVDPGIHEQSGPFLHNGQRITKTVGGFELEKVLSDAYPILKQIDPDELATILSELSRSASGMGPTINRTIANGANVLDVQAKHDADMQLFLDDLSKLSGELAKRSPDLVATAKDLNVALPDLNARGDELGSVLTQAARLSSDAADVLEANRGFLTKSVTEGGKTLQVLFDQRTQIPGLLRGLRYFLQVLAEIGRFDMGDGTISAAVKAVLGGGSSCGRTTAGCPSYSGAPAGAAATPGGAGPAGPPAPGTPPTTVPGGILPLPLPVPVPTTATTTTLPPLPAPQTGTDAIQGIVTGVLP